MEGIYLTQNEKDRLLYLFANCIEYFNNLADVDYSDTCRFIPNKEMQLLTEIRDIGDIIENKKS